MRVEASVVMFEYSRERSWAVENVRFEYLGGSYRGRGRLIWDPERGFHLDAFLDRDGVALPRTIEFGKLGVSGPPELRAVRMSLEGSGRAISPRVRLGDQLELSAHCRLDIDFPSILFSRSIPQRVGSEEYRGGALFEVGKSLVFPDSLVQELRLNERPVKKTYTAGGIAYNDDSLRLYAYLVSESQMHMEWVLTGTGWSKADAWNYAEGAQAALSFLSGRTVRLLERTTRRGAHEYFERRKQPDIVQLGLLSLPPRGTRSPERIDKATFVQLARFFTQGRDSTKVLVCRQILAQMTEASQQQTRAGQELLCANVLDAALRTLIAGKPYDIRDGSTKLPAVMNKFRQKYLSARVWKRPCKRVVEAYNDLRHRNAHPDWLTTAGGGLSDSGLQKSLDYMICLAWFYGYMILSLAGFKKLKPKFPGPHKEWPAILTFTSSERDDRRASIPARRRRTVEEIRRDYPNAYAKWSEKDDELLAQEFHRGKKPSVVAVLLGRQPSAIRSRLRKLGLV